MLVADIRRRSLQVNVGPSAAIEAVGVVEAAVVMRRARLGAGSQGKNEQTEKCGKTKVLCGHAKASPVGLLRRYYRDQPLPNGYRFVIRCGETGLMRPAFEVNASSLPVWRPVF